MNSKEILGFGIQVNVRQSFSFSFRHPYKLNIPCIFNFKRNMCYVILYFCTCSHAGPATREGGTDRSKQR